jgi:predicted Zn-dependent protease with MMP-like domain
LAFFFVGGFELPAAAARAFCFFVATLTSISVVRTNYPTFRAGLPGYALLMVDPNRAEFEEAVQEALDSLPPDLRKFMSNVAIVVEEEPPPGMALLGLYEGFPLTRRGSGYAGVPPDKITIYRRPLEQLYGEDPTRLRREIRRVVLHEIAHHFGISDERLVEIGRY